MFWFTVLSNSKEIKLGDRYQETLPSAGKNSGVVLVPCRPRKCVFFKKMGLTPCKAEQPLQGTELQEKEAQKH